MARIYYYKARIYHPKLGRFLQTDPIGYEDQMNLYAYVKNDPLNFTDSTGKCGEPVSFTLCAIAVFGSGYGAGSLAEAMLDSDDNLYGQELSKEILSQAEALCNKGNIDACILANKIRRQLQLNGYKYARTIGQNSCVVGTACGGSIPTNSIELIGVGVTTTLTSILVGNVDITDVPTEEEPPEKLKDKD